MKETTRNFLVGIFTLLALTTAAILMVWFGETPSWLKTEWVLQIRGVREIRGISEGSPVQLSGVEIGRVASLDFEDWDRPGQGVIITARIKEDYTVPQGSTARVYGATMGIGTGQISIVVPPAEAPPLAKDGTAIIEGEMASPFGNIIPADFISSFQQTVDNIGDLAASGKPVADNFAKLIEQRSVADVGAAERGITGNLSTVIERFDALVDHLNAVLGDEAVQTDLKDMARDLKEASTQLRQLADRWNSESQRVADNVNEGIDRTEEQILRVLTKLASVADRLDDTADNIQATTRAVRNGEGTIGLMVNDPRLYESAVLSFDRLGELLARLNRIAGKIEEDGYITIAQKTALGTFRKDFPVGPNAASSR